MKSTAIAPSNIAFVKYWGKKDEALRLPENGSISMNLSEMHTTTTVEFSPAYRDDDVTVNGRHEAQVGSRVVQHLDRVRRLAQSSARAKVVSVNNFPASTGLSSSASGFAALTVAAAMSANLKLSESELSVLARQGSGSACRSVPDGFVQWLDSDSSDGSYALSLFGPGHWDLVDVVALVATAPKEIATSEGMRGLRKSPFYGTRISGMKEKIEICKTALQEKNLLKLGELIEAEALEMHAVMMTQQPPLLYWTSGTLQLVKQVMQWRQEGLSCYFTLNTGQDIHIITESGSAGELGKKVRELTYVRDIIVNQAAVGVRATDKHLF